MGVEEIEASYNEQGDVREERQPILRVHLPVLSVSHSMLTNAGSWFP